MSAAVDNRFFGLHALNNLDIAVNGKEVNSMPSYREVKRRSVDHLSFPPDVPEKPPRNMESRGYRRHDAAASSLVMRMQQQRRQSSAAEDSAIASGGDEAASGCSYYAVRNVVPPPRRRSCLTDTEILRSPSEVLYAVSDKQRWRGNDDDEKENTFKTRITVISPTAAKANFASRKPYRTTINTATDNIIQHRGVAATAGGGTDGEQHYKVPRSVVRRSRNFHHHQQTDSDGDQSSVVYRYAGRSAAQDHRRTRNWSGCSTSPDGGDASSPERRSYAGPPPPLRSRSGPMAAASGRSPSVAAGRTNGARSLSRGAGRTQQPRPPSRSRDDDGRRSAMAPSGTEDRLAKFTEYRGGSQDGGRERGQSLPPGASIESMRDFYKSSRYRSMYALQQLPPSPTRPAPVLDRRPGPPPSSRLPSRRPVVSVSEGDVTAADNDEGRPRSISRMTKRQAPSPPTLLPGLRRDNPMQQQVVVDQGRRRRRVLSNDRGGMTVRRFSSGGRKHSDGLDSSYSESDANAEMDQPRPWSSLSEEELDEIHYVLSATGVATGTSRIQEDAGRPPSRGMSSTTTSHFRPPSVATTATIVRIQKQQHQPGSNIPVRKKKDNVIFNDVKTIPTFHPIIKADKHQAGDFGRRWTANRHHSDADSDYRREMATSAINEARVRGTNLVDGGNAATVSREEERRKVLQIEEERVRMERELRSSGRPVSRSASRATSMPRVAHVQPAGPRGFRPSRHLTDLDRDSQYSGHSSSASTMAWGKAGSRYDQHHRAPPASGAVGSRVRRSTTINNANGHMPGTVHHRKKMPGSLTSSVNSSESDHGGAGGGVATGQRAVFLHAAAVADIPTSSGGGGGAGAQAHPARSLSADSKLDVNLAAGAGAVNAMPTATAGSNLKGSKKISRSISLLGPWKPRPAAPTRVDNGKLEIHYDNRAVYSPATSVTVGKPPRPPLGGGGSTNPSAAAPGISVSASRRLSSGRNRSVSSSNNLPNGGGNSDRLGSGITGMAHQQPSAPVAPHGEQQKSKTFAVVGKSSGKVSRSVSMPKDTRMAGWFKKRKRV